MADPKIVVKGPTESGAPDNGGREPMLVRGLGDGPKVEYFAFACNFTQ